MHHYALMTDATSEDLNKLEYSMKSFFSKKMQGTLSLEQVASAPVEDPDTKDSVVTYTDGTRTVATVTTKTTGDVVTAYYTLDGSAVYKTEESKADGSEIKTTETTKQVTVNRSAGKNGNPLDKTTTVNQNGTATEYFETQYLAKVINDATEYEVTTYSPSDKTVKTGWKAFDYSASADGKIVNETLKNLNTTNGALLSYAKTMTQTNADKTVTVTEITAGADSKETVVSAETTGLVSTTVDNTTHTITTFNTYKGAKVDEAAKTSTTTTTTTKAADAKASVVVETITVSADGKSSVKEVVTTAPDGTVTTQTYNDGTTLSQTVVTKTTGKITTVTINDAAKAGVTNVETTEDKTDASTGYGDKVTKFQTITVTTPAAEEAASGMSTGAIIGIVVAILAVGALIGFGVHHHQKKKKHHSGKDEPLVNKH
jgi:hypothetical protein